jgi:hypothetical protein
VLLMVFPAARLRAGKRQRLAPDRDYDTIAAPAAGAKKGPMLEEAAMALLLLDNGKVVANQPHLFQHAPGAPG